LKPRILTLAAGPRCHGSVFFQLPQVPRIWEWENADPQPTEVDHDPSGQPPIATGSNEGYSIAGFQSQCRLSDTNRLAGLSVFSVAGP
jgi:hypothetical protein